MFNFIKKVLFKELSAKNKEISSTDSLNVISDDWGVKVRRSNNQNEEIKWNEMGEIFVITTDDGPFMNDLFLCLSNIDGKSGCAIPGAAEGYNDIYDRVSKFQGFDYSKYIEAMSCATKGKFICWRR